MAGGGHHQEENTIGAVDDHPRKAADSGQAQGSLSTTPRTQQPWVGMGLGECPGGDEKRKIGKSIWDPWFEWNLFICCKLTPCWARNLKNIYIRKYLHIRPDPLYDT